MAVGSSAVTDPDRNFVRGSRVIKENRGSRVETVSKTSMNKNSSKGYGRAQSMQNDLIDKSPDKPSLKSAKNSYTEIKRLSKTSRKKHSILANIIDPPSRSRPTKFGSLPTGTRKSVNRNAKMCEQSAIRSSKSGFGVNGIASLPVNGRVFGIAIFVGQTEGTRNMMDHKQIVHKKTKNQSNNHGKGKKKRKCGEKRKTEGKAKPSEHHVKKSSRQKSSTKPFEEAGLAENLSKGYNNVSEQNRVHVQRQLGSHLVCASINTESAHSESVKKSNVKSPVHEDVNMSEKTVCKVEISGKKKDKVPTLVVKVCAKVSKKECIERQ